MFKAQNFEELILKGVSKTVESKYGNFKFYTFGNPVLFEKIVIKGDADLTAPEINTKVKITFNLKAKDDKGNYTAWVTGIEKL